jgi:YVTN family beta-propeller protein
MYVPTLELTSGAGSLWVTDYDSGTVVRVNPESGHVITTIKIGGHPFGIAFGANRIWVTVS